MDIWNLIITFPDFIAYWYQYTVVWALMTVSIPNIIPGYVLKVQVIDDGPIIINNEIADKLLGLSVAAIFFIAEFHMLNIISSFFLNLTLVLGIWMSSFIAFLSFYILILSITHYTVLGKKSKYIYGFLALLLVLGIADWMFISGYPELQSILSSNATIPETLSKSTYNRFTPKEVLPT